MSRRSIHAAGFAGLVGLGLSCAPVDGTPAMDARASTPLVGRLQLQSQVVDLTVESFGDESSPVPTNSVAEIMADTTVDTMKPVVEEAADLTPGATRGRRFR